MRAAASERESVRRPSDRKARIVTAATTLFCERGYHNVSVADVAGAVGITAPALYRHFRGKPDLLLHVVTVPIEAIAASLDAAPDLDSYLWASAAEGVERRGSATLWQREARHLPAERRAQLRRALSDIASRTSTLIRAVRPELSEQNGELLAWAVLSVYGSISGHRVSLPRRRFEDLLHGLALSAAYSPLGDPFRGAEGRGPRGGGYLELSMSRREEILSEAIRLFDERGFQSVSTDDIGEAAGASGPSIYKHFPSKTDLLVAAVVRGGEQRRAGTALALARATTPRERLDQLLRSYIEFALHHSHLIGLLISELEQLPEKERRAAVQTQRDYLALWVRVLDQVRPGLERPEARIVIGAVLTIVDNAARTGRLGERADLPERLTDIGMALLLPEGAAAEPRPAAAADPLG
ncbi:TetR/AcrR family transcriptional regulator [Streptomyces sp. AJS327]|uniref:TetR/AcrR family transcriptional regulator n=1 Tax=Streptomyces sp. AJS327 TaxID=2545265 RepID=UPI0015DDDE1A|nr:TetR/AcrR family transcriptional regulator [Streptomyces sp. AJS327]MBA0052395.1 TetR/AcrR family transcriptional regulator [Streptomyces sp. AJS327]